MVIFANGTAIGDERAIAFTFESRRREHDALQQVETLLADVIEQSGVRWETFEAIDRQLDDPRTQSIRDSTAFGHVRQNVRLWIRLDQGDQKRAAFHLQYLLSDVRSKLALANEHMQRRYSEEHLAPGHLAPYFGTWHGAPYFGTLAPGTPKCTGPQLDPDQARFLRALLGGRRNDSGRFDLMAFGT